MIFDFKKTIQALNYFIHLQEDDNLSVLKAIKLLWIADRHHLRQYGRPITFDDYYALKHGPVASTLYDILTRSPFLEDKEITEYSYKFIKKKRGDARYIKSIADVDFNMMSETDKLTIEKVSEVFKNYGQFELRDYSHKFPEWKKFEEVIEGGISKQKPISYLDFFKERDEFFDQTSELIKLNKKIFINNYPSHFTSS